MIAKLHDLCLVLVLFSAPLLAGDVVSLNIKGKIVAAPCQISSDSVARTISLTDSQGIRASSLYTPGSATEWVPFDFDIERCPAGTTTATMQFSGNADNAGPDDLYQNSGSADNIAIQLQTAEGQPLGKDKTVSGTIVNNQYRYRLRARAFSPRGGVTPGTINAVVTVTFTWQ
ncbi:MULTISPECIES: fimbrial protein [Klebsiella]|uniref:fimbrial protein n=1 Tax=Klebsiella TaxID=570 RepID=UPI000666F073|nr:fimbrial protein [Klebsiella oxytoca]OFN68615.1 fimbrial protein [Enterobacter sp. HMSC055A11]EKX3848423.1 type 1 fimbrial protein [Klebsiella oxytoca]MBZ7574907.1 type 1 fimbrial protein [Klebsiella oxytoca]NKX99234.1 type 1 fimbrial protein [Klebsiella oxytoca]SAQ52160.1 fimbrial protein FimG [Klebsiella oxytoca]